MVPKYKALDVFLESVDGYGAGYPPMSWCFIKLFKALLHKDHTGN